MAAVSPRADDELDDATRAIIAKFERNAARYRSLFMSHPQPMYVCDLASWQFIAVNEAALARYGYTRDEFLSLTLRDIRPDEDVPLLERDMVGVTEGTRSAGLWRHRLRDGSIIVVDISTQMLDFDDRQAMLVLAIDMTDRVATERALRESLAEQTRLAGELQRERTWLVDAQAVAKVGCWEVDIATLTGHWSDEMYAIHGRARGIEPLTRQAVFEWFHPDDRAPAAAAFQQAVASPDGAGYFRHRIVLPDGTTRVLQERWRVERDAAGTPVRMLGTCHDITEHEAIIDALQLSEERFRLVAEAAHVAIWDWDLRSDNVWWNEGFETVYGVRSAAHDGMHSWWRTGLHHEDRARVLATLDAALQGDARDWSCEYRFRRADGSEVFVHDHAHIVRDATGAAIRMIGGTTDLTARHSAEARLTQQAALLDAAHDAILLKDLDDRIVYWNKGAERLFGWTASEAIGRVATELFAVEATAYRDAREQLLAKGQWEGELVKRTRDGSERNVDVRWTLVRNDAGDPRAVLAITLDVTERKRLEAQFLRAQRLESIGTLAGGIAHDLNNVLAPIMMSIELLRAGTTDPDTLETLETIEAAAHRGADMVKQVLTFARGADGERRVIDAMVVMRDVVKIARETFPKDIVVRLRAASDTWMVSADPTQLHQVMMNLAVNARDAMPDGGTLEIIVANTTLDETYAAMHPGTSPGPHLSITVADTGTGIPLGVQDRLFEPFFTTKEQGKGTGLGLSTVHSIVRTHGGSITVYSEPGKGARFVVLLPALVGSASDDDGGDRPTTPPRGNGELILVVDDEEGIRTIVQKTLERFGYRVVLASNGAEGVARYLEQRREIAAVLTDMAMPVMDGPAMAVALQAIDPAVRIIGSSGMLNAEKLAQITGAGVAHFVAKPYTADELLGTLAVMLAP